MVLTFILGTVALLSLTGMFFYRKKAVRLDLFEQTLFGENFELSMELIKKHWDQEFNLSFQDIATHQMKQKLISELSLLIMNSNQGATSILNFLKKIADYAQGGHPLATMVINTTKQFFGEPHKINAFYRKVSEEYWMESFGKKVVFVSDFICETGKPEFLIQQLLSVEFFEEQILQLIATEVTLGVKKELLNEAELSAFKKLIDFYAQHTSNNPETEYITSRLAKLSVV